MDTERLTETALAAVASAQSIAQTRGHQTMLPAHVVTALLADTNAPASRVLERAGGKQKQVMAALDAVLEKQPKVSGSAQGGQYMDNTLGQAIDEANKLAKDWGDSFVAADTLLVALRQTNAQGMSACQKVKCSSKPPKTSERGKPWTANPPKRPSKRCRVMALT